MMNRMIIPPPIESRLTQRAKNALFCALSKKGLRKIQLLYALSREPGAISKNILEAEKLEASKISAFLEKHAGKDAGDDMETIIKRAAQKASLHRQPYIGTEHLLYALTVSFLKTSKNLRQAKIGKLLPLKKFRAMKKHLDMIFSQNVPVPLRISKHSHSKTKDAHARKHAEKTNVSQTPALDAFCESLSDLSEQRLLDPVIGRQKEINRILCILSRRTKNNPLLVGEPGVGKTAIVHGISQKIESGEVPSHLSHKKILSLNLNALLAGTVFRGDFEARMHDIIEEASTKDVVLFIDEVHNIIGAGSAPGTLDAANILKPALSNGTLRCIGATTLEEYKKYIEKDRALERRFQPVFIEEETEEESIKTLLHLKKLYEKHHEVSITNEAVEAAVRLAARYVPDRFLPDKAIDVLDEAASKLKNDLAATDHTKKLRALERKRDFFRIEKEAAIREENYQDAIVLKQKERGAEETVKNFQRTMRLSFKNPTLRKEHVEEIIAEISGVPIAKNANDRAFLQALEIELNKEIIGQKEAIRALANTLKRKTAGLSESFRPFGSFLFLGPSGVGKTALVKALATKTSQALICLNMAEYAEPHTISRLLGSPPGYVGYDDGGELTEKIRRNPYAVVLFDEIEKAHPQIHNILLSILEDGILQDATGKRVSFRNATIILTSNVHLEDEGFRPIIGFSKVNKNDAHKTIFRNAIREALRPEIINRVDKIIVFRHLGKKDILAISALLIEQLKNRLPRLGITVKKEVANFIAEKSYKPSAGARYVRSAIERLIETPLAEFLIANPNAESAAIFVQGNRVVVSP